jgi:hypothetical protein
MYIVDRSTKQRRKIYLRVALECINPEIFKYTFTTDINDDIRNTCFILSSSCLEIVQLLYRYITDEEVIRNCLFKAFTNESVEVLDFLTPMITDQDTIDRFFKDSCNLGNFDMIRKMFNIASRYCKNRSLIACCNRGDVNIFSFVTQQN